MTDGLMMSCFIQTLNHKTVFTILWLGLLIVAVAVFMAPNANAVEFKIIKGKQYQLCQDLTQNLARFPDLEETLFYLPFDSDLKKFRRLKWQKLNPANHLEEIKIHIINQWDLHQQLTPDERLREWNKRSSEVLEKLRNGKLGLEKAFFDANADGRKETVYRFGQYIWPARYHEVGKVYAWTIYILKDDNLGANQQLHRYSRDPLTPFYYDGKIFYFSPGSYLKIFEPVFSPPGLFAQRTVCKYAPPILQP